MRAQGRESATVLRAGHSCSRAALGGTTALYLRIVGGLFLCVAAVELCFPELAASPSDDYYPTRFQVLGERLGFIAAAPILLAAGRLASLGRFRWAALGGALAWVAYWLTQLVPVFWATEEWLVLLIVVPIFGGPFILPGVALAALIHLSRERAAA